LPLGKDSWCVFGPGTRPPVKGCIRRGRDCDLLHEDCSAVASRGVQNYSSSLLKTQLPLLGCELHASALLRSLVGPAIAGTPPRKIGIGHLEEIGFGEPGTLRIEMGFYFLNVVDQYYGPFQLSTVFLEVGRIFRGQVDRLGSHRPIGAG